MINRKEVENLKKSNEMNITEEIEQQRFKIKAMTLKQAIRIVENHNKWRRDNNVPPKTKMGDPKKLGVALDVLLIVAKDYYKIYDMDRVQIKPK